MRILFCGTLTRTQVPTYSIHRFAHRRHSGRSTRHHRSRWAREKRVPSHFIYLIRLLRIMSDLQYDGFWLFFRYVRTTPFPFLTGNISRSIFTSYLNIRYVYILTQNVGEKGIDKGYFF